MSKNIKLVKEGATPPEMTMAEAVLEAARQIALHNPPWFQFSWENQHGGIESITVPQSSVLTRLLSIAVYDRWNPPTEISIE
jgi:hypothetical protein